MTFELWLKSKGFHYPEQLSEEQKAFLLVAYEAATKPPAPPAPPPAPAPAPAPARDAVESTFDEKMRAIEVENQRRHYIGEATLAAAQRNLGNPERIKQIRELGEAAISDVKMDQRTFDLALLRLDRMVGPMVLTPQVQQVNEEVIEAAICVSMKLSDVENRFSDQTLQAARTRFKRGVGLQELIYMAAERNSGYRGSSRDLTALCRAAFRPVAADGYYPSAGPSTIAVPGILSNVANKFLAAGFLFTEQAWRQIARIKPANDFKQMSTYRLTGANKFEKVAPGGKIKHGTLSELTYTNQVETYGKMLGIDRRDIRNDDLGAFTGASDELGRGAGDSLNEVFWTEWLDDSTFFPTDKSLANYDDGATDSVLSLAGLENANLIFRKQTKPDGTPLGAMPAILLVPADLDITAANLMNGVYTASAQSTATLTTANVFQGKYRIVSSVYLSSTALTGYSVTAWYLLADPGNIACIEVAFLDGVETPTVETSEFDFDMLGLSMRAYMDFGTNKQEPRGGVKLKGAA